MKVNRHSEERSDVRISKLKVKNYPSAFILSTSATLSVNLVEVCDKEKIEE